jgi:hypothetical protein
MEESARRAAEIGFVWWEMVTLYGLALSLLERGRAARATPYAQQALAAAERVEDLMRIVPSLALFSRLALEQGDSERAGRLWGALEAETEREPVPGWTPKDSIHAEAVLALAGNEEFERGRAAGAALTLEEVLAEVRAGNSTID